MKILFIGGTGNISTDCAALLRKRGHEISVVTRGKSRVRLAYDSIVADRKNLGAMQKALEGVTADVVINFLGYEMADVETDYALFAGKVSQYIFISTAMVYAKPHLQIPIAEQSPLGNPYSPYARNKLQCEQWLLERHATDKFPVTIVRPSHTYSKRWIPNTVSSPGYWLGTRFEQGKPMFVANDGENPWTLTATSDFAVGLAGLVGNEKAVGESFHITSDEALSWNQIYTEIAAAVGNASPVIEKIPLDFLCERFPETIEFTKGDKAEPGVFDNSKIKRFVPDFKCKKPFAVGIRESVAWLGAHPEDQHPNPQADALVDAIIAAWREKKPAG
ncbi:MAG TPA: NAD-dependent epimerase/dehydratase family protein [Verrucomicrobiae bacterium]|nr:NAD-dependent epimerase/dehydratase family protein [Verrucomicrobiae bacterium]